MSAPVAAKSSEPKATLHVGPATAPPQQTESSGPYAEILRMQRKVGNRAVVRMMQPKLNVSTPGDRFEQEADLVAHQVMRMTEPGQQKISRIPFGSNGEFESTRKVQRRCQDCEDHVDRKPLCETCKENLQRSEKNQAEQMNTVQSGGHARPEMLSTDIHAARAGGRPLPMTMRSFFEPRFGYDFGQVRIHTGAAAGSMAQAVNARAFTVGRDIFFGVNQYSTNTLAGRQLMAHELAHVLQQSSGLKGSPIQSARERSTAQSISVLRQPLCPSSEDVLVQREGLSTLDVVGGVLDPKILIGKIWLGLSDEAKAKYVNRAIDAALTVVDKFPGATLLGGVWEFLKAGLIGFYGKLKTAKDDLKIKAIDTIAVIMAGQSVDYSLAMLKGLAKGFFVEGAAGIFIAAWELLKGLKGLWDFLKGIAQTVGGFPEEMQQLLKNFQNFTDELLTNIGPAIEEFINEGSDPQKVASFINTIAEKGKAVSKEAGEKIADALLNFFTKKGAQADIGEAVGLVVGQVLWEVLFAVVTAGAGAAVTAGKTAVKGAAKVLAKIVGKVVGSILKLVEEIRLVFGKVVEFVKKAVTFVKGKLAAIGGKLSELLEGVGKFLKRLLDNCHESKLKCQFTTKEIQKHFLQETGSKVPLGTRALEDIGMSKRALQAVRAKHHLLVQQLRKWFASKGINIDKYTIELVADEHRLIHNEYKWNEVWKDFQKANPHASPADIMTQMNSMLKEFGLEGLPIIPYR